MATQQYRMFTVPIFGGEDSEAELNRFLRSKRVALIGLLPTHQRPVHPAFGWSYQGRALEQRITGTDEFASPGKRPHQGGVPDTATLCRAYGVLRGLWDE